MLRIMQIDEGDVRTLSVKGIGESRNDRVQSTQAAQSSDRSAAWQCLSV